MTFSLRDVRELPAGEVNQEFFGHCQIRPPFVWRRRDSMSLQI